MSNRPTSRGVLLLLSLFVAIVTTRSATVVSAGVIVPDDEHLAMAMIPEVISRPVLLFLQTSS